MPRSKFEKLGFFRKKRELAFRKINSIAGKKYISGIMKMPVDSDTFYKEVSKLINVIFEAGSTEKKIVVDQGGSFWNPVTSTKYYDSRKVVIVTRDPRDIFWICIP